MMSEHVAGALRLFAAVRRPAALNARRADRAALLLVRRDADEDRRTVLVDILTDLRHFCARAGIDWMEVDAASADHFNHEATHERASDADAPLAIIGPGGEFTREVR